MNYESLRLLLVTSEAEQNIGNYGEAERLAQEVIGVLTKKQDEHTVDKEWIWLCAEANRMLGAVSWRRGDLHSSLHHHLDSLTLFESINDAVGIAKANGSIGLAYSHLSEYPQALEYITNALHYNELLGDKGSIAGTLSNLGVIHKSLENYTRALEYFLQALTLAEEGGNLQFVSIILGNIGGVYRTLAEYDRALEYYNKAVLIADNIGFNSGVATQTGNIGSVYFALSDFNKALEYYKKALSISEQLDEKLSIATWTGNIGEIYSNENYEGYDLSVAEEILLRTLAIDEETGAKDSRRDSHCILSELYEKKGEIPKAYYHHKQYHLLEKEIQSNEATKKAEQADQKLRTAEREKYLAVERAKHEATEQLLHNVLPPSIAQRMVAGESLIAERLTNVSILFADIVNFTKLSSRITAEELVAGLDSIFSSFDALAEKYGLEKIKTIGDAYMVVSGAPEPRKDHALAMAGMALEMIEAMKEFRSVSTGEEIQIRIGIHSGEVVAGVIGKKKFAYDLWGDAVNTASRMESQGEAGRIHVSEEFKNQLKQALSSAEDESSAISFESTSFAFVERAEIEIKGKGMMSTFFLEMAKTV